MPSLAGWEGGVLMKGGKVQGELWKTIRRGWIEFQARTKFEVRGGRRIRFWHDLWCGNSSESFVSCFVLHCQFYRCLDGEILGRSGRCWALEPLFFQKRSRLGSRYGRRFSQEDLEHNGSNRVWGQIDLEIKWGNFHVKSYYSSLESITRDPFPVKQVWGFGLLQRWVICLGGNLG